MYIYKNIFILCILKTNLILTNLCMNTLLYLSSIHLIVDSLCLILAHWLNKRN